MAIFGGMGQIFGQALGATFLTLLSDMLLTKFPYYYMLLYGVILITVILFLPNGLVGLKDEIKLWLRGMRQQHENT